MIPDLTGANWFKALAIGAKQFVVQEAAEITVIFWLLMFRGLHCNTIVGKSFPAGAEITTLLSTCFNVCFCFSF